MVRMMIGACVALTLAAPAAAQVRKGCDGLKAEIDQKIQANGVQEYTLEIVPADDVPDGVKVVGTCEGDTKKIVYRRGRREE